MKTKSKLRAMLINCNSVKSNNKISQLQATIHATDPDIILLVETKLDSSIPTYYFLPFNYEAIRNDRNTHGGGVLIAVRTDIIADPQDKLNTACEIIWTKVHFLHTKSNLYSILLQTSKRLHGITRSITRIPIDPLSQLQNTPICHPCWRLQPSRYQLGQCVFNKPLNGR